MQRGTDAGVGERTIWGLDCESRCRTLKRRGFAWQGAAVERECNWCLSEPRTVRFGCGHSLLCGGCLEAFLATNKPCVPLHPRAEEDALMLSCHSTRGLVLHGYLAHKKAVRFDFRYQSGIGNLPGANLWGCATGVPRS